MSVLTAGTEEIFTQLRLAVVVKKFMATGGAERYAMETTRRLCSRGHQVALVARQWDTTVAVDGLSLHRLPDYDHLPSVLNSWLFARDAARLLTSLPLDAVISHEHGFHQDIAVVHTFPYRRGLARYPGIRKIDQLYLSPRSWLHLYLEAQQMHSGQLTPVSETIRDDLARYYHRTRNVTVVNPGVDLDYFSPGATDGFRESTRQAIGVSPEETVILFVGNEFRRKGLDDLIAALGAAQHLVVVGKGERWPHYRRLVRRLGMTDQVHFAGLVDDVRPWYAAADLLVLPSIAEAFGMCVLEAMACGLPVIVRSDAGAAALVKKDSNGFVFHHVDELPTLLARLTNKRLRQRLGNEARRTAQNYTWDNAAERLETLSRQVAIELKLAGRCTEN
ncbi:glycosyltransferase family 4 protein [uncultured Desulfobacter sp.]|uniref:glycosyltransferase family 4 protein n=1 Tax=uncultured Desulfobacter sp. TaxID=240139 RepID=UPI0029F593C1|nr:glycosyltransferase family 4 protein [uncultured Desulfobacter sp.]